MITDAPRREHAIIDCLPPRRGEKQPVSRSTWIAVVIVACAAALLLELWLGR